MTLNILVINLLSVKKALGVIFPDSRQNTRTGEVIFISKCQILKNISLKSMMN